MLVIILIEPVRNQNPRNFIIFQYCTNPLHSYFSIVVFNSIIFAEFSHFTATGIVIVITNHGPHEKKETDTSQDVENERYHQSFVPAPSENKSELN